MSDLIIFEVLMLLVTDTNLPSHCNSSLYLHKLPTKETSSHVSDGRIIYKN